MEIEFRLRFIDCVKSSEEGDELYVQVGGQRDDGSKLDPIGYPAHGVWKLSSGQSTGPNETLYEGELDQGLTLDVRFREEDARGFISLADDYIGGLELEIMTDGAHRFSPGKQTEDLGTTGNVHKFRMTGSDAEYVVEFQLFEKRSLIGSN